ncbi:LTA synthase family protein [Jeotgalibacillus sp. R-1-5s-1]|uniref:LTA synthase family protein n=1 Tax=Jeotgalibacillus sp. R-1-5s-1 TaxID=2555897 RepID=UPI00106B0CBA|nr:LTA synthase family protein [Jeotgalibacillus sp. R-1-5s-1]TFD97104.1 LTA synthase family protein [Jeotgalibacillus sp. R-1-5s-1]
MIYIGFIFLLIFAGWSIKTNHFVNAMNLDFYLIANLLGAAAFGLILISIIIRKITVFRLLIVLFIYSAFSFLMISDVLYERYYKAILSFDMIGQADQLEEVDDSVYSLITKSDLIYVSDVVILLVMIVAGMFLTGKFQSSKLRKRDAALLSVGGLLIFAFLTMTQLKEPFSDQYKVARAGIIPAHLFITGNSVYETLNKPDFTSGEGKTELEEMNQYFRENQEQQRQSPYFGQYKGKNVILFQAESLNDFVVNKVVEDQEITPHLNALIKESDYYPSIYNQIGRGNTSDAEFVANNSLYPSERDGAYRTYEGGVFQSLGVLLSNENYHTSATHGNTASFWNREAAYPNQGFQEYYHIDHPAIDSTERIGLGVTDDSMLQQMTDIYSDYDQPFYNFFISLSNHRPFELPEEMKYLELSDEINNTPVGDYLQNVRYADEALGNFISSLKEKGIWEDTIFVYYGDHYGLLQDSRTQLKNLIDVNFNQREAFNVPLVIHRPGQTEGRVDNIIGGQMDIAPTITSLLGIEQPVYHVGRDLNSKEEGFIGFRHETTKYSYFGEEYVLQMSHVGDFDLGSCVQVGTNEIMEPESCKDGFDRVKFEIELSDRVLQNDAIKYLNELNEN